MNRDQLLERALHHYQVGTLDEARSACAQILRAHANDVDALNIMAAIAADERKTDEGMGWVRLAVAADPTAPGPHYTMGRLSQGEGRLVEAEEHYKHSLALKPDQPKALNNLGAVLHMQGKLDLAVASYRRALELDPALPQANQNLASITRDRSAAELAVAGFLRQLQDNPKDAKAHADLANVYRELGRHQDALASFASALAYDPELAEAHFARSFELLLCGDYREGWKEFEWRWKVKGLNTPMRKFPQPLWDGGDLPGRTVLLHAEQGLGDTIQFVRYAPLVARRCGSVVLECQPELVRLLAKIAGVSRVYAAGEQLPPFDAHLPLMSLPRVFDTTMESIPWDKPYMQGSATGTEPWGSLIAPRGANIGLVWAGQPRQWDDRKRTITLSMFAPLKHTSDATFYSLQKGAAAAQAASPPEGMRFVDLGKHIEDFADTAAMVRQLDLVITVDTSVAHLAAAMGVPTWVLLPDVPDWRYHLEREDNLWYPSMRVFRQRIDGDWPEVIDRLAAALSQRVFQPR